MPRLPPVTIATRPDKSIRLPLCGHAFAGASRLASTIRICLPAEFIGRRQFRVAIAEIHARQFNLAETAELPSTVPAPWNSHFSH